MYFYMMKLELLRAAGNDFSVSLPPPGVV